eukprot:379902_1
MPTKSPLTVKPTNQPTHQSTLHPTFYPTLKPTYKPTSFPTNTPSTNPTSSPTLYPSIYPTQSPTLQPIKTKTRKRQKKKHQNTTTLKPTFNPTTYPTKPPKGKKTTTKKPTRFPTTKSPTLSRRIRNNALNKSSTNKPVTNRTMHLYIIDDCDHHRQFERNLIVNNKDKNEKHAYIIGTLTHDIVKFDHLFQQTKSNTKSKQLRSIRTYNSNIDIAMQRCTSFLLLIQHHTPKMDKFADWIINVLEYLPTKIFHFVRQSVFKRNKQSRSQKEFMFLIMNIYETASMNNEQRKHEKMQQLSIQLFGFINSEFATIVKLFDILFRKLYDMKMDSFGEHYKITVNKTSFLNHTDIDHEKMIIRNEMSILV